MIASGLLSVMRPRSLLPGKKEIGKFSTSSSSDPAQ